MKLLTIIVTFNAMPWLEHCIESVMDSTVKSDIFVLDNGSTDGTRNFIKTHYPQVFLVCSERNLKFGRGNNVGLEYALKNGYDFVYLLNQDAYVLPDTFERLLHIYANSQNEEFGILSPLQLTPEMDSYESIFKWLVASRIPDSEGAIARKNPEEVCPVEIVQAAHWLVSRRCLEKVGGFSPSFPHYGEDNNYCKRVLFNSFKIGVVPSAKAVHDSKPPTPLNSYKFFVYCVDVLSDVNDTGGILSKLVFLLKRARCQELEGGTLMRLFGLFKAILNLPIILHNCRISKNRDCAFLTR